VRNGHGAKVQLVYVGTFRKKGAFSNFASVGDTSRLKSITYVSKCRYVSKVKISKIHKLLDAERKGSM